MNGGTVAKKLGVTLGLCTTALCAWAGPLDKSRVDAGARWLVHVDVESVMRSGTGAFLAAHQTEVSLGPLEEFKARTGLDVFRDIFDVTVYGTTSSSEDAVAIVRGSIRLEEAVDNVMKAMKGVERTRVGTRDGFTWTENGTARFGCLVNIGAEASRAFVVSRDPDRLERALRVMDGLESSLHHATDGALSASPRSGSHVFIVAADLSLAAPQTPKLLRGAKDLRFDVGEDAQGMFSEVTLRTETVDDAQNIVDFGRGLLAVGRMACTGDSNLKGVLKVIDGVKLEAAGSAVRASVVIDQGLLQSALDDVKSEFQSQRTLGPAIEKTSQEKGR